MPNFCGGFRALNPMLRNLYCVEIWNKQPPSYSETAVPFALKKFLTFSALLFRSGVARVVGLP